jgi:glucuronate isomerase
MIAGMKPYMDQDFLLHSETARQLYHTHAAKMPIFDYHNHLPAQDIAGNVQFRNLGHAWLGGDHYKWRAMRTNGVPEKFCTGNATDFDKFMKWAETMPRLLRNPLYDWTHLELQRFFGIADRQLNPATAQGIYEECSAKLQTPEFSTQNLLLRMNVKAVCTTDAPADDLAAHRAIANKPFGVKVLPTFRPDKAMQVENHSAYNTYVDRLSKAAGMEIRTYDDLLQALERRHTYFHEAGCRLSDHALDTPVAQTYTRNELHGIFVRARTGEQINAEDGRKFKTALMLWFGTLNHRRNWTMQLHMGALRGNNSRMTRSLGPDTGFDSIGDPEVARPLTFLLDMLDRESHLPRTILYNLNPRDNELLASMAGNFQDDSVPGKIQFGAAWWFNDHKRGMELQLEALSALGLLSRFVGMLTDSRSFLSFPRHEYFRRILCNMLGREAESGEIPADMELLGGMVEDICFRNAKEYFGIEI